MVLYVHMRKNLINLFKAYITVCNMKAFHWLKRRKSSEKSNTLREQEKKIISGVAMRANIQHSFSQKEAMQNQVKLIGVNLDGVRKEKQVVMAKIK